MTYPLVPPYPTLEPGSNLEVTKTINPLPQEVKVMAKATKAEEQRWAEEQKEPNKRRRIPDRETGEPIRGLYYRWGTQANGKPERIFYATVERNLKTVEEKVGREFTDDVSVSRAEYHRDQLRKGAKSTRREKMIEATEKAQAVAAIEATRKSFDTLWAEYQEWRTSETKGRWTRQKSDEANYKKYLLPVVGSKTPAEVTDADIEQIHGRMSRTKGLKGNKSLAPATRKMILALLVRIAAFGVERKRCPGLTVQVELPEVDNVVTEVLTKDETARLLKVLQAGSFVDKKGVKHEISQDAIDLVYLLVSTGMRRGEVLGIEWKNVDYQAETILIPNPKEKKSKVVHINPIVLAVLESRKDNGSAFVFPCRDWKEKDGHIVDPKRSLNLIKKLADLPADFRCAHGFRHNWATWALTSVDDGGAGIDIYTVSKSLGHKSIKTTERYLTLIDKSKKNASNRMAAIFAPKELPENVVSIK